jgi:hypothetical protein
MPIPTPLGHIFDSTSTVTTGKANSADDATAHREQMVKGADVAAQEASAWTTFGNELAEWSASSSRSSVLWAASPTCRLSRSGTSTWAPKYLATASTKRR